MKTNELVAALEMCKSVNMKVSYLTYEIRNLRITTCDYNSKARVATRHYIYDIVGDDGEFAHIVIFKRGVRITHLRGMSETTARMSVGSVRTLGNKVKETIWETFLKSGGRTIDTLYRPSFD